MTQPKTVFFSSWLPSDSGGRLIQCGLEKSASEVGLSIETHSVEGIPLRESFRQERLNLERCAGDPSVAGVIVQLRDNAENRYVLEALLHSGKPVIFLGRPIPWEVNFPYDFVGVDNATSAKNVVQYLISQGHRSIAHITSDEAATPVQDRLRGYRAALEAAGIPFRPELCAVHDHDEDGGIEVSEELLCRLLRLPSPPTALFAVHDWAAIQAMLTAHLVGLCIPGDLAVAGFDGIARFRTGGGLLTSAYQPFEEMGRRAVLLLEDRLRGGIGPMQRQVYLEAPLHIHESTECQQRRSDAANHVLTTEGAWRSRVAWHFIRTHLAETFTLQELARVVGVSPRRLLEDFETFQHTSPMHAQQELRLRRVRAELQQPTSGMTVTEVAVRWGVTHLGRFSAQYRKTYGELPSEALARAQRPSASPFSEVPPATTLATA